MSARRLRAAVVWLVVLGGAAWGAPAALAAEGSGPLEATWDVPAPVADIGATVATSVRIDAAQDVRGVTVRVSSRGPVSPATATLSAGDLAAGGQATVPVPFAITAGGTATLHAEITGVDAAGAPVRAAVEIDAATGGGRVAISRSGLLDAQEQALAFERAKLGGAAYRQRLDALRGAGATTEARASTTGSLLPATTTVNGLIRYKASNGTIHPSRTIQVQVRDADGTAGGAVLKTLDTDATGAFTTTVGTYRANGTRRRLFVRAFAKGEGFIVKGVGATTAQYMTSGQLLANGGTLSFTITGNGTADNNTAFNVADTLVSAIQYTKLINGNALLATITASFPNPNGTNFSSSGNTARILKLDRFDWDVILHEYGHFVSAKMAFDANPGGSHSFSQNMGETLGKDAGTKMAWSEGFATYFAVSSEDALSVSSLGIPKAGDAFYDDTEDSTFHVPLATNATLVSRGEDDELSVARTLWHFLKDAKTAIADTDIIAALKADKPLTLSAAVGSLVPKGGAAKFDDSEPVDAARVGHSDDFACVLTNQAVASKITAPAANALILADKPPTISWSANGAGPSNRLDQFTVQFWTDSWDTKLFESPSQSATSYTPSDADWKTIVEGKDKSGKTPPKVYIVVKGTGSNAPSTGPYKSCKLPVRIGPAIKTQPVQAFLSPFPTAPACSGLFPSDINQFILNGTRMKPSTQYALRFKLPNAQVALANVTTDADGLIVDKRVSIPLMQGHSAWVLNAIPPTGSNVPTPTTKVGVTWTSCLLYDPYNPDFTASWGGAGVKAGSIVSETWNGTLTFTTRAATNGSYSGSYAIHCPQASNNVEVDVMLLDGPEFGVFDPPIPCTPALTAPLQGAGRPVALGLHGDT